MQPSTDRSVAGDPLRKHRNRTAALAALAILTATATQAANNDAAMLKLATNAGCMPLGLTANTT